MLVRDVVVAVLRMEERSDAEADVREARDDRGVYLLGGGRGLATCCTSTDGGGGGGGGGRRVVVADEEDGADRAPNLGDAGVERGDDPEGGVTIGGNLDVVLWGNFGGAICLAWLIAFSQSKAIFEAVEGLIAEDVDTFSNESSKLFESPSPPLFCWSMGKVAICEPKCSASIPPPSEDSETE